jgi:hypothetical protein
MLAIEIETEYRSVTKSFFGWGPKKEPNAPIAAGREVTDFLRWWKLIRRSDSSMIAIGVELEYRYVARSLSR